MDTSVVKKYQVILTCNESVNTENFSSFINRCIEIVSTYDNKSLITNQNIKLNNSAAYPVQGKKSLNTVYFNLDLTHTSKLGAVIDNITRKLHSDKDILRVCILDEKKTINAVYDIDAYRASVEPKIYS